MNNRILPKAVDRVKVIIIYALPLNSRGIGIDSFISHDETSSKKRKKISTYGATN